MPDTGAPWNIPYVEAADLVSDWPADSLALANAIDAGLDAAGNAGIGSNVVQAIKTDSFTTSSSTYVDVTDLEVTITPSSNTSKILLIGYVQISSSATGGGGIWQFLRDSTAVGVATQGTRKGSAATVLSNGTNRINSAVAVFLDTPATASAVTYKIQVAEIGAASTVYVNRYSNATSIGTASGLIAIEVAA